MILEFLEEIIIRVEIALNRHVGDRKACGREKIRGIAELFFVDDLGEGFAVVFFDDSRHLLFA